MKNKVRLEVPFEEKRQDSFWFDNSVSSATVKTKSGKEYMLVTTGEIKVATPQGDTLNDIQALEYAYERNWTDKDLERFEFLNNNWFEILEFDENEVYDCGWWDIDNFSEGIKVLEGLD